MKLAWLKEPQIEFLREGGYIGENQTPQERYQEIVDRIRDYEVEYQEIGLADRMSEWLDKNYIHLSTPVMTNFGRKVEKGKTPPLPASCNIVTVNDSIDEIWNSDREVANLSKLGAGVGADFQNVVQKGTLLSEGFYSNSKLDYIERFVDTAQKVSQGKTRRGYCTPFIGLMDSDFDELMRRVDISNPDKNDVLVNNTVGIILPQGFDEMVKTDKEVQRRYLIALSTKKKTGKVYLVHVDNMNKNSQEVYKKLGMVVATTNICTEFVQPLFKDMTSVCVLSALNLVHWDEINKNHQIIRDLFIFLDIVNEEYVRLTENIPAVAKAHRGAKMKRDIGAGTLGFHEYLQMKGCAYGDVMSRALNKQIYSTIRKVADETTRELAERLGPAPLAKEAGIMVRNCSLMMIAPNKSTSFLADATSLGIEPFMSNIYPKKLAKIQYIFKNKHLEAKLEEYGKNTKEVWQSIQDNNGSVQHLDFLSQHDKNVFKTFAEISPKDIIDLASERQVYIDMAQSLNLVFRKNYTMKDIYDIHKYAWEKGIKTLYYGYASAHASLEKEGEAWDEGCSSCAD